MQCKSFPHKKTVFFAVSHKAVSHIWNVEFWELRSVKVAGPLSQFCGSSSARTRCWAKGGSAVSFSRNKSPVSTNRHILLMAVLGGTEEQAAQSCTASSLFFLSQDFNVTLALQNYTYIIHILYRFFDHTRLNSLIVRKSFAMTLESGWHDHCT